MHLEKWMMVVVLTLAFPVLAAGEPDAAADGPVSQASASQAAPAVTLPEVTVLGDSEALWQKNNALDEARDKNLLPQIGDTTYDIGQEALQALPQGDNTPIDKVLLQAPGVSYDSAISNPNFHVRNEYANVQYRINGIQLPDGVSALGPILETGFIGNLNLLDGSLPAQYGLRTAGVVDITTKTEFDPGGNLDLYGGTWDTFSPTLEYGGGSGRTQYFFTGSYLQSQQGLENAMPTADPIHDNTTQGRFFGYGSTLFGDSARLTYMAGAFAGQFQIPDIAGQTPLGDYGPATLDSTLINDNETDQAYFGIVALQTHDGNLDTQTSVYMRYASIHYVPDVYDELVFNDEASNVSRQSLLGGAQFDAAQGLGGGHTLRSGVVFNLENTWVDDLSTVLPLDSGGTPLPNPVTINDSTNKLGWTGGVYLQDEWRLGRDLTVNGGLRFDAMDVFVSANQLSPRLALDYQPGGGTDFHAGVSRYFTPPMQAQSTPNNLALFQNTTQQPYAGAASLVEPERAWYFDAGVDQKLLPGLSAGLDAYYKVSTDTLDDANFGDSVVLDQFNYANGYSQGLEFKANYAKGGFRAYGNLSYEITRVEEVVSNQYLIDGPAYSYAPTPGFNPSDELGYIANNYVPSSDSQLVTSSFGVSCRWHDLLVSVDGIYGSGLAAGFANEQNEPAYTQFNAALAWSLDLWHNEKPLTLRLSAVNIFDTSYFLRSGTGVGEFAAQYGPRRGLFADISQRF